MEPSKLKEQAQKAESKVDSFLTRVVNSSFTVYMVGAVVVLVIGLVLYLAWK
jgi:hypothetical protein